MVLPQEDRFVIILLLAVLLIWGWIYFRRWWNAAPEPLKIEADPEILVTDAVALLEQAGYEVLTMPRYVPVEIVANGEEMESRIVIDHFARKADEIYIVKLARDHRPLEMSESSLRDNLLIYHLMYPDAGGILYVDPQQGRIDNIRFSLAE